MGHQTKKERASKSSSGVVVEETFQLEKQMTNNEAEYEVLLFGLELALGLGV